MTEDLPKIDRKETRDRIEYKATPRNRRDLLKLVGAATGSVALAGCAGGSGGDEKETKLSIGIASEPWNLDPALFTDTGSSIISSLIYDEVVGLSPDNKLRPELATDLAKSVDDEGKVWDISLKEGVKFHNGTEMTFDDFKYTIDWIANPENNAAVLGYAPMLKNAKVEKKGKYKARLKLTEPNSFWNAWMTRAIEGVVPKDSRGDVSESKGPKGVGTNLTTEPIGTGPFKFKEWKSGSHVTLEAFPEHFRNSEEGGAPLVDTVEFKFIAEPSTRMSQLRSGSLSMMNRVPAKDYKSLKNESNAKAKSIPGRLTVTNYLNQNPKAFGEKNPMANVHNRRAFHYGIDAEQILRDVWHNQGVVQKGPWFPDSEWTSPKLKDMEMFDPEKAKAELKKGPNPDGFTIKYMARNTSVWRQVASIIQSQLSDIGITVEIQTMEKSTLFSRLYGTSRWHVAGANWFQGIGQAFWWLFAGFAPQRNHNNWHHKPEDGEMPNKAWKPNGPAPPEGEPREKFGTEPGSGHAWYKAKINEAFRTTDKKKQKEIAYTLEEYIVDNVIQSDMAYINRIEGWRKEVSGYEMGRFSSEYRTALKGEDAVPPK